MEDLTADQIAELIGDDCEPLEDALTGGEMATFWHGDPLRRAKPLGRDQTPFWQQGDQVMTGIRMEGWVDCGEETFYATLSGHLSLRLEQTKEGE
tara:strand:+ start:134 stop:418 length:285 start_codon:yes stop_codon:yes gene_type:complete